MCVDIEMVVSLVCHVFCFPQAVLKTVSGLGSEVGRYLLSGTCKKVGGGGGGGGEA